MDGKTKKNRKNRDPLLDIPGKLWYNTRMKSPFKIFFLLAAMVLLNDYVGPVIAAFGRLITAAGQLMTHLPEFF
tara:strand:+ start:372 stop:593 length:222 start_codon:yes stop_codon:yes gene_type:complete